MKVIFIQLLFVIYIKNQIKSLYPNENMHYLIINVHLTDT